MCCRQNDYSSSSSSSFPFTTSTFPRNARVRRFPRMKASPQITVLSHLLGQSKQVYYIYIIVGENVRPFIYRATINLLELILRVKQDMDLFGLTKEMAQDLWRSFHSGKPSNLSVARKSGRCKRK